MAKARRLRGPIKASGLVGPVKAFELAAPSPAPVDTGFVFVNTPGNAFNADLCPDGTSSALVPANTTIGVTWNFPLWNTDLNGYRLVNQRTGEQVVIAGCWDGTSIFENFYYRVDGGYTYRIWTSDQVVPAAHNNSFLWARAGDELTWLVGDDVDVFPP